VDPLYLDNNATTRPLPEVVDAMRICLEREWANPSSVHRAGVEARRRIELARESVARLIGCQERELLFCSGGTEAANLAILGTLPAEGNWLADGAVLKTAGDEHAARRRSRVAARSYGRSTQTVDSSISTGSPPPCASDPTTSRSSP